MLLILNQFKKGGDLKGETGGVVGREDFLDGIYICARTEVQSKVILHSHFHNILERRIIIIFLEISMFHIAKEFQIMQLYPHFHNILAMIKKTDFSI
jgi:hypothetical protein